MDNQKPRRVVAAMYEYTLYFLGQLQNESIPYPPEPGYLRGSHVNLSKHRTTIGRLYLGDPLSWLSIQRTELYFSTLGLLVRWVLGREIGIAARVLTFFFGLPAAPARD